jgi:hypothetical protein
MVQGHTSLDSTELRSSHFDHNKKERVPFVKRRHKRHQKMGLSSSGHHGDCLPPFTSCYCHNRRAMHDLLLF